MSIKQSPLYNQSYGFAVGAQHGYGGYRNNLRIKKFTQLIDPSTTDQILEIGCNRGLLLSALQKYAPATIGIDVNQEVVQQLASKAISYMSATDLRFKENTFNKVCAFEVIEHISDIKKVFTEVYKILKKGGVFIISFPVELIRGQSAILDAWNVYKNPLMARQLHVHKLTPSIIQNISQPIGFVVIESRVMFIPFPSFVMKLKK